MKKIYKLSFIALMSFIGLTASAQSPVTFGVEAGVNLSNSSWDMGSADKKARVGFQLGVTAEYGITEAFYLQSGLSFTTKGAIVEDRDGSDYGKVTIDQSYLQLPIYAAYKIEVTPGTKIVFNAGPYLAYGVDGKISIKGNVFEEEGGTDVFGKNGLLNEFDFGLGAGVGAEFGKFTINLRYELGLTDLGNDNYKVGFGNNSYKNRNAALTVGYKF